MSWHQQLDSSVRHKCINVTHGKSDPKYPMQTKTFHTRIGHKSIIHKNINH